MNQPYFHFAMKLGTLLRFWVVDAPVPSVLIDEGIIFILNYTSFLFKKDKGGSMSWDTLQQWKNAHNDSQIWHPHQQYHFRGPARQLGSGGLTNFAMRMDRVAMPLIKVCLAEGQTVWLQLSFKFWSRNCQHCFREKTSHSSKKFCEKFRNKTNFKPFGPQVERGTRPQASARSPPRKIISSQIKKQIQKERFKKWVLSASGEARGVSSMFCPKSPPVKSNSNAPKRCHQAARALKLYSVDHQILKTQFHIRVPDFFRRPNILSD